MSQDWLTVFENLDLGDPDAMLVVSRLITGLLVRTRAYAIRDSWDDLNQDVLLALLTSYRNERLRSPEAFPGYVSAIVRNKVADRITENRRRQHKSDSLTTAAEPVSDPRDDELLLDLDQVLREMGERERNVVESIYLQGYSYEESARRLGLPLGTLKRVQTTALQFIRRRLVVATGTAKRLASVLLLAISPTLRLDCFDFLNLANFADLF